MGQVPGRVFGYARVSSAEQGEHGTSLEGQRAEILTFARSQGWPEPLIRIEVESGGAEKIERRVELQRTIADARPGDVIVVAKVDRWSRDIVFGVASVRDLVRRGVGWRSIGENVDASTPHGDSTLGIMAWVADQERRRIRERTVGTRRRLRALGGYVEGLPPFGYAYDRATRRLVNVEERAAVIREVFERAIAGESIRQISTELVAAHPELRGFDPAAIARKLHHRAYLGAVESSSGSGQWIAAHEPIVTRATFAAAHEALAARRTAGRSAGDDSQTASFLVRGLARCGACGQLMYSIVPKRGGSTTHAGWYACRRWSGRQFSEGRCKRGSLARQDDVDAEVEALTLERLGELVAALGERPPKSKRPKAVDWDGRRDALIRRRERVVEAVAGGAVTAVEARATLDGIAASLEALEGRREDESQAAERAQGATAERRAERRAFVEYRKAWSEMSIEARRAVVAKLTAEVRIHPVRAKRWARGAWRLEILWAELD